MDEGTLPSLLSLPYFNFVPLNDEIYKNTRNLLLKEEGNPFFFKSNNTGGPEGIGSSK
jgi:meiotically up-regulated gene 157 (Mug157) protein